MKEYNIMYKRIIINTIGAIFIALFFISFSVIVTLNFKPLYKLAVDLYDIPEKSGYSYEEIIENYSILIEYNSIFGEEKLEFTSFTMSEHGEIHFEEVKAIFIRFQYLTLLLLPLVIITILYKIKNRQGEILKYSGILTLGIPIILGTFSAMNWEWVFVTFHEIAFDNDYWIFNAETDPVINILPEEFFMMCAIMIIAMLLILSIIQLLFYRNIKLRKRN